MLELAFHENAIDAADKRPNVRRPVGVIETALKGKQARYDLLDARRTTHEEKWSKRHREDEDNEGAELHKSITVKFCARGFSALSLLRHLGIGRLTPFSETMPFEQKDEIRRC